MTAEKPGRVNRSPDPSPHSQAATMMDTQNDDKIYTNFNVKNFTSAAEETNDNNAAATAAAVLNILIDENKSIQKSIALLHRNIHELLVLLKDKKTKDRERRF